MNLTIPYTGWTQVLFFPKYICNIIPNKDVNIIFKENKLKRNKSSHFSVRPREKLSQVCIPNRLWWISSATATPIFPLPLKQLCSFPWPWWWLIPHHVSAPSQILHHRRVWMSCLMLTLSRHPSGTTRPARRCSLPRRCCIPSRLLLFTICCSDEDELRSVSSDVFDFHL